MIYKKYLTLGLALAISGLCLVSQQSSSADKKHSISISITGLKNNKGQLIMSVFTSQSEFKKEKPAKHYKVNKQNVKNGRISTRIELPAGTYGIALLDDENLNNQMDYRGPLPLEGFGFGGYYHKGWTRPVFSDFRFVLSGDKSMVAKMRYM